MDVRMLKGMPASAPRALRLVRNFGLAALFLAVALFGIASGVLFAFVGDLPQISALDDYSPSTITRVLGRDDAVVGEFASERRELVTYDRIPPVLRNAILSAEDGGFFRHSGLSIGRISVALAQDLILRRNAYGASTITQQLARNLFPASVGFERSGLSGWERKIKEALLAVQIEKRYTKQEIFTMYCNKVYWGHLTYGVEAASQLYFAKHVSDLNLDEAALIAGIINGNQRYSPYVNPKAALVRRNYTLDRMAEEGYISAKEAATAKARPIVTRGQPSAPRSIAPYFLEQIRIQLEDRYGEKAVYEGGLSVRTGINAGLQRTANRALDDGLRRLDKRRGNYRKPAHNLLDERKSIDTYSTSRWNHDPAAGDIVPAVVTGVEGAVIHARIGAWQGTIPKAGYDWARRAASALVRRGDVIEVRVKELNAASHALDATLEQEPLLQGAVVAVDNHTGQILAMIGGISFERSQFNRAIQAMRQVGSLFKPFVYTAAIDRGYTPTSTLLDEPVSFPAGPGQPLYEPKNYERDYEGEITLRRALEHSRNVPTVRLMNTLGPTTVIAYAKRMGISSPIPPYLSSAIGAGEANLLEMTSAYTSFPNQGVRMAPLFIDEVTDREGNVLEQHRPEPHEAIRADTAYIMTSLLEGVIQHGTGAVAATEPLRALNWPLGGKTGTTDDFTDAWFIGFDPDITLGVWVGFDVKKPIGGGMSGAVAALPIWSEIMSAWIDQRRQNLDEPPGFSRPGNVVVVDGEAYIAGTEPGGR
jgi:penicillin-binding protein 1A